VESLQNIECFVRSAEAGNFAKAARLLGLTPAAVGKNVGKLERSLGVRLFQRTTRSLALTEEGSRFLDDARGGLALLQSAVANLASAGGQPAGTLKVSLGTVYVRNYIIPLLPKFLASYPGISPDFHFDNHPVDLVRDGFDAAIGGGFELPPGVMARRLAPAHRVLVASPAFARTARIATPADLAAHPGILVRSPRTGRVPTLPLRNAAGTEEPVVLQPRLLMSDPDACCQAAMTGMGIALASMPQTLPYLADKRLVRVLPEWHVDAGHVAIYFPAQKLLPARTRAFVDFVVEAFRTQRLDRKLDATRS